MSQSPNVSPVNPLPAIVSALFLILMGVELVFQAGARGFVGGPEAVGWRLAAVQTYAFSGEILEWMWATDRWPMEHLIRFVSYPFIHGNFTEMLFAGVMFLAMGKLVTEVFGTFAMLVIFFLSSIGGALAFTAFTEGPYPLVGAFPAVYGLIGAYTWLLWRRMSLIGENQARAFSLIGVLMAIQLIFGLFFDLANDWVADLAGFATGFLMSFLVSPGGWARVLQRMRKE
ncbi:MAG: rhomboid family intramembrane serine protease [Arenibacterium sp.]